MVKWILEPGHTEAEFKAKHMMVTWVRGLFKDIHGEIQFDPNNPKELFFKGKIDVKKIFTGEPKRDEHLLSSDFFDAKTHPFITFESIKSEQTGGNEYKVICNLTMKGITKQVSLYTQYQGSWQTSYWTEKNEEFLITRIGFNGKMILNRNDFNINWNSKLKNNGIVVGNEIFIQIDGEGLLESEFDKIT